MWRQIAVVYQASATASGPGKGGIHPPRSDGDGPSSSFQRPARSHHLEPAGFIARCRRLLELAGRVLGNLGEAAGIVASLGPATASAASWPTFRIWRR